jgi:O-antigen/teichoic acid export membrane protein
MPVIGGILVAGILFAPAILKIFGGNYSDAADLLRLVLLAVLIRMAGKLGLAGLRVNRQFRRLAVAQATSVAVTISGVAIAASHHSLAYIGWSAVAGALVLVLLAMKVDVAQALMEPWRDRLES